MKTGRNSLCPCGSGIKYKKCCLIKEEDNQNISNQYVKKSVSLFQKTVKESRIRECLHPDKENCSEKIVKAHSIQNNKILKRISKDGIVYMPKPKSDNPFLIVTPYGRNEATVFTGFCNYHDKTLFQPIEDNLFIKTTEQIFLYVYRCFAIEYHHKKEKVNIENKLLKAKEMKSSVVAEIFTGYHLAFDDFELEKSIFDKAIINKQYDILTSVIWEFNQQINFTGSGFEAMDYDLKGNKIQSLSDRNNNMKHIFVTIFCENDKTYCIIAWLKENDNLFKNYKNQLNKLNEQQRKNYINNLLPMISENIAINPGSWDKLEQYQKEEFGSIIFGMESLGKAFGYNWNRLTPPSYDLFKI